MTQETPQVYVNVSSEDGGTDVTVTRGEVEVIHIEWDDLRAVVDENRQYLSYVGDPLAEARQEIEKVADEEYRSRLLSDLDGIVAERDELKARALALDVEGMSLGGISRALDLHLDVVRLWVVTEPLERKSRSEGRGT